MIKHIVFTKFTDPTVNVPEASRLLNALPAQIPQILSLETGEDLLHSSRSFDMALIVTFRNMDDLRIYDTHPAHQVARDYIKTCRTGTATVDYEF